MGERLKYLEHITHIKYFQYFLGIREDRDRNLILLRSCGRSQLSGKRKVISIIGWKLVEQPFALEDNIKDQENVQRAGINPHDCT